MDSIRPLQNYEGDIVPQAVLNGTLGTVVYASTYNDLDNKPSINSVELRGNKTAEELGLATPEDITVTSVNEQTGDVSLTGQNIPYDSALSVNEKINDLESQITDSGVSSVNGQTGVVNLTGNDINYSVGVSLNNKIDAVESEIPTVNYPVTSVNNQTGAVVLNGSDLEYSAGVTVNDQIDNVMSDVADVSGDLSALTSATLPYSTDPNEGTTKEKIDTIDNSIKNYSTTGAVPATCTISSFYASRIEHIYSFECEILLTATVGFNTTIVSIPAAPKLTNIPIIAYSPDLGNVVNLVCDIDGNIRATGNINNGIKLRISGTFLV